MGKNLSKLDILAISASGVGADKMYAFLQGLREDAINLVLDATLYHKAVTGIVSPADATDLPTALVLVNDLRVKIVGHLPSTGIAGAHLVASGETIAAPAATDLTTAQTLANELKADYNTHLAESGVHINNDVTNAVAAANATNLATLLTLVNEIKADYNVHGASSMASVPVE